MDQMLVYDWPGNVRQLKNVAERLIVRARGNTITTDDLPRDLVRHIPASTMAVGAAPAAPPVRRVAEELLDRMLNGRESFWTAVYPAFMTRDLTRDDLRFIVSRGLQETSGSYKLLVELLNMRPADYKRFLNFLRKHECRVPFERFRSARLRGQSLHDEPVTVPACARTPVLDDMIRVPAEALGDRFARH
jgi:transcriptional regulator with AAA-type ATPase domain